MAAGLRSIRALGGRVTARLRHRSGSFAPIESAQSPGSHVLEDLLAHLPDLRSRGGVHRVEPLGQYLVVGYEEARSVLTQPLLYSSACLGFVDPVLVGADPPEHTRTRRLLTRYFIRAALEQTIATLDEDTRRLLAGNGPWDAVADIAIPLTRQITSAFLGMAPNDLAEVLAVPFDPTAADARRGTSDPPLYGPLRRSGMYARIIEESDGLLSDHEACSLVRLLCIASTETSERLIARSILTLLQLGGAAQAAELHGPESSAALAAFVDEVSRLYPPEAVVLRVATASSVLSGTAIPAQAPVLVSLAAANRDPARFEAPDEVRLNRAASQHLAFGFGPHHCVGAGLGRRIVTTVLEQLLAPGRSLRACKPLDQVPYRLVQGMPLPERLMIAT